MSYQRAPRGGGLRYHHAASVLEFRRSIESLPCDPPERAETESTSNDPAICLALAGLFFIGVVVFVCAI